MQDISKYDWYDLIKIRDILTILASYEIYNPKVLELRGRIQQELKSIAERNIVLRNRARAQAEFETA